MNVPWHGLDHLQNFFQLDFLFSGLKVSTTAVFVARVLALLLFGAGIGWAILKIVLKSLDCVQTFVSGLNRFPRSFFLLLLLVVPLSADSVGARWMGYILLLLCLAGLGVTGALIVVLWKYGVDQALRLINNLRARQREEESPGPRESSLPADNIVAHPHASSAPPVGGNAASRPQPA